MQLKNKWGLHLQSCYFNLKSSKQKVKYHIVDNQVALLYYHPSSPPIDETSEHTTDAYRRDLLQSVVYWVTNRKILFSDQNYTASQWKVWQKFFSNSQFEKKPAYNSVVVYSNIQPLKFILFSREVAMTRKLSISVSKLEKYSV